MTDYYRGLKIAAKDSDDNVIAVEKDDNYYTSAETAEDVLGSLYAGIDSEDSVSIS